MNPAHMKKMMQQLGIQSTDIPAMRVVIECEGKNIVVDKPSVTSIAMGGQKTFQISGESHEEAAVSQEDVALIMSQTGCTQEQALQALKDSSNDLAEAILKLKKE